MIVEVEKGRPRTVDLIQALARRYGNTIEIVSVNDVYDVLHVIGDPRQFSNHQDYIADLPGVERVWRVTSEYKNIARVVSDKHGNAVHRERRVVELPGPDGHVRRFGGDEHVFALGPDSVQTLEQTFSQARALAALADRLGIRHRVLIRAGAFKPRTRPTDFRGLGMEAIYILDQVREETGLPYVTEVMDPHLVDEVAGHADMLQVGTRNAQNFDLLESVGRTRRPVILKRGFGNTAAEWFSAAEYVANQGNLDVVLCERGIRTMFATEYCRFTPDFNVIRYAREKTTLPVMFDPSHPAGDDRLVTDNLLAAVAYQADGSLIETIHSEAFRAQQLCDARQALHVDVLERAIVAVLAYEAAVSPHVAEVESWFEKRSLEGS